MSKLTAIFICTTAVATIMAVQLWRQLHLERDSYRQFQASTPQHAADGTGPGSNAQVPPATAAAALGTVRSTAVSSGGPQAAGAGTYSIDVRQLLKDPKFREAQYSQVRLRMPQMYPDLAKEIGLAPGEAQEFFDLLAKQQLSLMALTTETAEGDEDARKDAQRKLITAQQDDQTDISRFLGDIRARSWRDYQQSLNARRMVRQLGTLLSDAGDPLTDAQVRPLIALIAAEQQRTKEESRSLVYSQEPGGQAQYQEAILKANEESTNRIVESARSYLNQQQLAALEGSMPRQTGMARIVIDARGVEVPGSLR